MDIGIDTNIEVIVASLTTREAHHSSRVKPEGCGELPLVANEATVIET